jgi:hypothetical protein
MAVMANCSRDSSTIPNSICFAPWNGEHTTHPQTYLWIIEYVTAGWWTLIWINKAALLMYLIWAA